MIGLNKKEMITMKTNILVGIALCLLLLALPAAASDYTLGVFGNANEDDTINMQDVTYTELIILEYRDRTELADAKCDGDIDILDMTQIALIILGREKELTILDSADSVKTYKLPIQRIIALDDGNGESLRVLGVEGLVVGVGDGLKDYDIILPEISKLPTVGGGFSGVDYEKVFSLEPDLFFTYAAWPLEGLEEHLEPYEVHVLRLDVHRPSEIAEDMVKLGYLLGKQDEAEEFVDFHEGYMNTIRSRSEGLPDDEKPQVFIEYYSPGGAYDYFTCGEGTKADEICTMAGGVNIAHDKGSYYFDVDPEWVIEQNPDIVIRPTFGSDWGYAADEMQKQGWKAEMEAVREGTMSRPGWEKMTEDIYIVSGDIAQSGLQGFVYATYMAKWFHPDLFADISPAAIHQEYIDRFLRIDYDLEECGAFAYPPSAS